MKERWATYDARNRVKPALVSLSKSGVYLNRAATALLPETTKYVILAADHELHVLRILRCAKSMPGKLTLQRLKGGSAIISSGRILTWLEGQCAPRTKYLARQLENGVALDLTTPVEMR